MPAAKWIHIHDGWQNDWMKPPEIRLFKFFLFHSRSHRCSPSHIFLTLRLYLAAASLSRRCFFSCPHINPSIYSMSLPTLYCCLCHWKTEEWVLRFQYAALSGQGKRKGEEESPIDRQANTSQALSTLSPLCSSARCQQMTGIWRGGRMRENSWCIVWATGWKCKERRMRGEAWGMEERALDWPLCWISPCYTNMRAVITYRAAAYGRESPSHAFTCTYTLSVN